MKAYKIELLVIDNEGMGEDGIRQDIQGRKFSYPTIMSIQSAEIGEWYDEHPLNQHATSDEEYRRLFPVKKA